MFMILILMLSTIRSYAQDTVGLVAHWDMNGTTNDVSGHGNNGNANNIIPAAGISGVSNTAYYFNGTNSSITVPYSPTFNFTKYTICATFYSEGFYTGLCQGNTIIARGFETHIGNWAMYFDDNRFNDCYTLDTTEELFFGCAGTNAPASSSSWIYSPAVVDFSWYKVVITYDSISWKIFVNGVLKDSVSGPGTPIGATTDSLSIGMDIYDAIHGYPYYFTGLIDDVMIYDRVLSDSEAVHYGDSVVCGIVTVQPANTTTIVDSNTKLFVTTTMSSPSYQWQEEGISGFVNLVNVPPYSGVTTDTLTFTGVSSSLNSSKYRCLISNSFCSDSTSVALLTVNSLGIINIISPDAILVYPDPSHNYVAVQLPYTPSKGNIQLINEVGQIISAQKINGAITKFDLDNLPLGMYIFRIEFDGQMIYKKVIKE